MIRTCDTFDDGIYANEGNEANETIIGAMKR